MKPLLERESDIQIANRLTIHLPRVIVIDDLFGRVHNEGRNEERASLCGQLLLEDVTCDEPLASKRQIIKGPVAQAVFCRGQTPVATKRGDTVENDLDGTLSFVLRHWQPADTSVPISMVLLDLSFYTGAVTEKSETKRGKGMPEGRDGDDQPSHYFGLQVLKAMHEQFPDLPVVILSSMPREEVKRHYSQMGALAFLPRGNSNSPALLQNYLNRHGLIPDYSGTIIGNSISLLKALRDSRNAAASSKSIMILGETGTGKELLARYLFNQTHDCDKKPFVKVNCGALSSELYDSELFGHVKGAFTGAVENKVGKIDDANGGDLFLDEIGNMPEKVQAGLLRAIAEKVVVAVGSNNEKNVNVRFLSATNVDIKNKDRFREDLYYRLTEGGTIELPSLRERKNDIPLLTEIFMRKAEDLIPNAMQHDIDRDAMDALLSYSWPGNIRELENTIFEAVKNSRDVEFLSLVHLPIKIRKSLKHKQDPIISDNAETITTLGKSVTSGLNPVSEKASFAELLEQLAAFDFSTAPERRLEWTGKLPALTTSYARAAVALLKASLVVTSKPTPDCPDGEFHYSPAVNLAVDKNLTPDSAKKEIKRILKIAKKRFPQELENDPVLRFIYDKVYPNEVKNKKDDPTDE